MAVEIADKAAIVGRAIVFPGTWLAIWSGACSDGRVIKVMHSLFAGGVKGDMGAIAHLGGFAIIGRLDPEDRQIVFAIGRGARVFHDFATA